MSESISMVELLVLSRVEKVLSSSKITLRFSPLFNYNSCLVTHTSKLLFSFFVFSKYA